MHVFLLFTATCLLIHPCTSSRIIFPPQFITDDELTPRMAIGNLSLPVTNFTSGLATTQHSLCGSDGVTQGEKEYYAGKTLMVSGFQGCSYERVARTAQSIGVIAVIFQSRQSIPGREATYTDGSRSPDINIPLFIMGNKKYDIFSNIASNKSVHVLVTNDVNPWQSFVNSPAPVVIQMLGAFLSLFWILAVLRAIYYHWKLEGFAHIRGFKVHLVRVVLFFELLANVLRLALFASDPFLIKTDPSLSWSSYIWLLIINVPCQFISNVSLLFICLIVLMPSRMLLIKAFFVAFTLAILGVDMAACATNALYRNPRGVDIYAVSFTLNAVEGFLIAIALAICCSKLLAERNKQIRYSPRTLRRIAVFGLAESFFLIVGTLGSLTVAWLAYEAAWLNVFTLCVQWIGLFGASGCQIACFPKGERLKKIKVIKVVDNDHYHTAHPMRKIVL